MYRMDDLEFQQYRYAKHHFKYLCQRLSEELEEAYEDIHPTRTGFNYQQGNVYSESLNVADYAIYLMELKEKHQKQRDYWGHRMMFFQEAWNRLSKKEQEIYNSSPITRDSKQYFVVLNKIRLDLEGIINRTPAMQRSKEEYKPEEIVLYDKKVDRLSNKELFDDYWDTGNNPAVNLKESETNFFEKFTQSAHKIALKNAF